MTKPPLRVVFMGTPQFAVPTLRALAANRELATVVAVYTQPDRPAGRGQQISAPAIKTCALELGLDVRQPESINDADEKRKLADLMCDIVVVVAYAQFLGKAVLAIPRLGCVNVHSSLLPKYRGAAPIQYAIWNGEKVSGVTTMKLVSRMDAGPILLQAKAAIPETMTASQLHDALSEMGGLLLIKTLEGLRDGAIKEIEQDESKATYAKLISKKDGLVDWEKNGSEIINQVRALAGWPGAFFQTNRGIIKILGAHFVRIDFGASLQPGTISLKTGAFLVKCADGWIELDQVQPEGKRAMSQKDFLNGIRDGELSITRGEI